MRPPPIEDILCQVIKKTAYGWDQAIQSLEQLGSAVIDSASTVRSWGKVKSGKEVDYFFNGFNICRLRMKTISLDKPTAKQAETMLPTTSAWDLGVQILL